MALSLPPGLTPPEIAFLCEMELVTVIPRQRMDSLPLISGPTPPLQAARSVALPLYLALLLQRQQRANIAPPPWLSTASLESILKRELEDPAQFSASAPWPTPPTRSNQAHDAHKLYYNNHHHHPPNNSTLASPPFIPHSTTHSGHEGALPYHWLELGEALLSPHHHHDHNSSSSNGVVNESFRDADQLRGLLRDIREVRQSKLRAGMASLEGGGVVSLRGVGAAEVAVERAFVVAVVAGLRAVGASREVARREREGEDGVGAGGAGGSGGTGRGLGRGDEDEDEDGMDF